MKLATVTDLRRELEHRQALGHNTMCLVLPTPEGGKLTLIGLEISSTLILALVALEARGAGAMRLNAAVPAIRGALQLP